MKNLIINDLNKRSVLKFTTEKGLKRRRKFDKPFKKVCNIFTKANIIRMDYDTSLSDEEYFNKLSCDYIPISNYNIKKNKNNIIVERYPKLEVDEPYIFVANHTCPEDIETNLNVIDRNAYLVLGSVETLKYNSDMYSSWANGMIPFDILDKKERKEAYLKMQVTLLTNSIYICPEGSHNYSPNKLVNTLYDGPINLARATGRKLVPIIMLRDNDKNISYVDVGNPISVKELEVKVDKKFNSLKECDKYYVNMMSSKLRDKMATSVYYLMCRHFEMLHRSEFYNIEDEIRTKMIKDAFAKLKWRGDVFEAEYLTKKTKEDLEYEDVCKSLSNLAMRRGDSSTNRYWINKERDLINRSVPVQMRTYWAHNIKNNKS